MTANDLGGTRVSETEIPDAAYEVAWEAFRRIAVGPALVDEDAAVAVVVDAVAPLLFQAGRDHERQKIAAIFEQRRHDDPEALEFSDLWILRSDAAAIARGSAVPQEGARE